ncbi:MAG: glycosyltransferase, partial [Acidobacteria bacterium]|nr:glycosyltransferase [Acidobacteriota bacterium]
RLRDENPSLRLILGWCGAPYSDPSVFRACDAVLSCVPELVEHFRAEGHRCHHLDHAFEPRILERLDLTAEPSVDFSFIGSIVNQRRFHLGRERLLTDLVERTDLRIWSEVEQATPRDRRREWARKWSRGGVRWAERVGVPPAFLASAPLVWRATNFASRPAPAPLVGNRVARRARPPLFGLDMFRQLRASRVALNTHIDISTDNASNMRLFEATGVGACLLTDWKANLPRLFEPDTEVVTYRGAEECVEKVKYLLEHERERRAISAAGQHRALRDHTFARRAERLDGIIQEEIADGARG